MLNFTEHEDRAGVLAELHLRPFQTFSTPHRILHFAFVINSGDSAHEHAAFSELCLKLNAPEPEPHARFHIVTSGTWTLRWELHTEFASYTWSTPSTTDALFEDITRDLPAAFRETKPVGHLLVSVDVALVDRFADPEAIEAPFDRTSLTVVGAADGSAHIASDFRPDSSGITRFLIEDLGMTPTRSGRLIQRLLELETYRCHALLGLPVARRAEPAVRHMENELLRLSREMTTATSTAANHAILQQLTSLSAELETQIAFTSFRLGATRAYSELVGTRLQVIRECEHGSYVSFSRFLRRRFNPAIATCNAIEARQQALATRLAHATDLLRTLIQSELEDQNRMLLASMNRRSRLQLRLQQTVEGLSIAAVSYYMVGLTGYIAKGAKDAELLPKMLTPEIVSAISVPIVVVLIWWTLHRARKAWGSSEK
jgi:uncharacterized membrane-anchored protein